MRLMHTGNCYKKIIQLIQQDPTRGEALECVSRLDLPQCYLAAGFVRNLVWDHLHSKETSTPLSDVDVIYFDEMEVDSDTYLALEAQLTEMMPQLNWQVRNQAHMHERNGDRPYQSSVDAMSFWPEKETAVAVRKMSGHEYECVSAFGFDSLFALQITHNPKRARDVFETRIKRKRWLDIWPRLSVAPG